MKILKTLGAALLIQFALATPAAHAALMQGSFTGTVFDSGTSSDGTTFVFGFADGLTVHGSFTYNSAAAPTGVPGPFGTWYDHIDTSGGWFTMEIDLVGIPWQVNLEPSLVTSVDSEYEDGLLIDDTGAGDYLELSTVRTSNDGTDAAQYYFDLLVGSSLVDFLDASLGVEQDFVLDGPDMDLDGAGYLDFSTLVGGVFEDTFISFDLDNVTLTRQVPEPALASLLLAGLVGLVVTRRRRA